LSYGDKRQKGDTIQGGEQGNDKHETIVVCSFEQPWRLSRGPSELPAAEQVKMKMVDRLAAVSAVVHDHPVSTCQPQIACQLADHAEEMSD